MDQPKTREQLLQCLRRRMPRSGELWQDAREVIPRGLLSAARRFEPYPFFTEHAQGPYIWDVDENRYIDCCTAFGILLLGHRPPFITEALTAQLQHGTVYGTPHRQEVEFARKFLQCVPCAEGMLVCNSGTEATMQAIRVLRAFTGKDRIAKFEGAYHGWHDYASWSLSAHPGTMGPEERPNAIPESAGIPAAVKETMLVLPVAEAAFDLIEEHASELAGVLVEPVFGTGTIPGDQGFFQELRRVTKRLRVPLMFDEVITGFRLGLGGAQEYFDVLPDIATYGKIIGGGLPIGAVGCSKEMLSVVTEDVSISVAGTFSGNPASMAAGNAMLSHLLDNRQIYAELERKGERLRSGFNEVARSKGWPATMTGIGSLFQAHLKAPPVAKPRDLVGQNEEALRDLQMLLRLNGVFIPWLHLGFLSAAHSDEDIEEVLRVHTLSVETALAINGLI